MPPPLAFDLPAFLLGLLFGSFLNVIITRLPSGKSIATPRSHCPICHHPIRPWDNIPVLSYLLLRARCRDCRAPIPARYPAVELLTALWFTLAAHRAFAHTSLHAAGQISGSHLAMLLLADLALATLGFFLLGLLVIDWQTQILPDALTLTGLLLSFLLTSAQAVFLGPRDLEIHLHRHNPLTSPGNVVDRGNLLLTGTEALLGQWLLSVLSAAAILLLIRALYKLLRHREGMGLGDVKLLALIAAFLGFAPALLALFLSVLSASLFAITLVVTGRAHRTTRLPFGSFLALGGLLSALFADPILHWYKSLL